MSYREWEYYSFIPYETINKEVFILLSLFGEDNKFLQAIQKNWFKYKDVAMFRNYIETAFEQIEVENKAEVDRDSLSCLLRMMSICDTFTDYEYIYGITRDYYIETKKNQQKELRLFDYSFKQYFDLLIKGFKEELKDIKVPSRYVTKTGEISRTMEGIKGIKDFKKVIKENYKINDLISDLLDDLEDDSDGNSEFESDHEVVLYNFAIYYSTKFYFGLLLREKIILVEEKNTNCIIEEYKPLIEEDDMRLTETQMLTDQSLEIFYKTLKN